MNLRFLPAAMTALALVSACSSGKGNPAADATASQGPSSAAADAAVAEDSPAFSSEVNGIAFNAVTALPKAPPSAATQTECPGVVMAPKSAVARAVAKAGWGVTGEGRIGDYQLVSFAGSFEAGTSGSCHVGKGNVAVFQGTDLRAIAYGRSGSGDAIGHIEPFGKGGIRIWHGDLLPEPVADMRVAGTGLVIGKLAAEERTCGGVVPRINEMPITRARKALLAAGWTPVDHGGPEGRADERERALAERGVVEVEGCSGTGFGYCSFDYQRAGASLAVTTVGDGEDPTVSDYGVKCGG